MNWTITRIVIGFAMAWVLAAADWPQWRGPLRDGISAETGLLAEWPADGPPLAWRANGLGGGFASVAVSNGRVYTQGQQGDSNYLIALDEQTGERIWQIENGGSYTNRKPFLPSVRRNLQREYLARLIDMTLEPDGGWFPQTSRTQAWYELTKLRSQFDDVLDGRSAGALDAYSRAHLEESRARIANALEASFELGS